MDRPYAVTHFKNEIWNGFYYEYITQPGVRYARRIRRRYIRLDFFFSQFLAHTVTSSVFENSRSVI
jgi:hypothetical protein